DAGRDGNSGMNGSEPSTKHILAATDTLSVAAGADEAFGAVDTAPGEDDEVLGSPEIAMRPALDIVWDSGGKEKGEGKIGAELIQSLVKRLPNAPGVYRMTNAAGDVLYV